jgi:hypothetical protein
MNPGSGWRTNPAVHAGRNTARAPGIFASNPRSLPLLPTRGPAHSGRRPSQERPDAPLRIADSCARANRAPEGSPWIKRASPDCSASVLAEAYATTPRSTMARIDMRRFTSSIGRQCNELAEACGPDRGQPASAPLTATSAARWKHDRALYIAQHSTRRINMSNLLGR